MKVQDVIQKFNTTPFLFAGSGITRRYYGLPNWEDLLKHFANRIKSDRFGYQSYVSKAKMGDCPEGILPKVATLIQRDFDLAWYDNVEGVRTLTDKELIKVEQGISPFKVEIAKFINDSSHLVDGYQNEIQALRNISFRNIAGVITTNYDSFFERLFSDYQTYVGQDELIFSPIQGFAEIYKIHGSVTRPETIIINEEDYREFKEKSKYLTAKLLTIFMEYPIIFMGYSLSDGDVQTILNDLVECLPETKLQQLQDRFVFVEYDSEATVPVVSSHTVAVGNRMLAMTKIQLANFNLLFEALTAQKAALPVKMLRRFKEELYTYAITKRPGPLLHVADIDNDKVRGEDLAISIGLSSTGIYGLKRAIDANQWYRDIVTDEFTSHGYEADQLLQYVYPDLRKQNAGGLPVFKHLAKAKNEYPDIQAVVPNEFEDFETTSIKKARKSVEQYESVKQLWEAESGNINKAIRLLTYLPEERINLRELEDVLKQLFSHDNEILQHLPRITQSNLHRLIKYYDYFKWKKIKTL